MLLYYSTDIICGSAIHTIVTIVYNSILYAIVLLYINNVDSHRNFFVLTA